MRGSLQLDWKKWIIVLFLIVIGIPFFSSIWRDLSVRPKKETKYRLGAIKKRLISYKELCGEYPKSLKELSKTPQNCPSFKQLSKAGLRDGWGQHFLYFLDDGGNFKVISHGKGGKPGGKGESEDLMETSAKSKLALEADRKKEELNRLQEKDGFLKMKCQNKPAKGRFGQSDLQIGIRRIEESLTLMAFVVRQTWRGTRAYDVDIQLLAGEGVESEAKVFQGNDFSFKIERITKAKNKWRGQLEAILKNPGDKKKTVSIKEIMLCRLVAKGKS